MPAPLAAEPAATTTLPLDIGELVAGKYRIERVVGLGGMAAVLAATHVELDQPVAVKLLLPDRATQPDAVRRFLSEARAAAKLKSEHVARILDVGTASTPGGRILPYMVMELLDGSDLASVVGQRGRLPTVEAIQYVLQACDAVAEAHALGIIHRDIKPANLFLTQSRDGEPVVKLLDFGISKLRADPAGPDTLSSSRVQHRAITRDGETMGSPAYMSPEQIRGAKDVDLRTDIWSLGVVLYELITGTDAFSGETVHEIFTSIIGGTPPSIDRFAPDVPPQATDIVSRCLRKDPDRRFQSVAELAEALSALLPVPVVPTVPVPALAVAPKRTRQGRLALLAAGAVTAGVVAWLAFGATIGRATVEASAALPTTAAPPELAPASEGVSPPQLDLPEGPAPRTPPGTRPHRASTRPPLVPKAKPVPSAAPRHRTDW